MMAMLAYGISPSAAAAAGAAGASSRPAGRPGTARITASASTNSGSAAEPTVSRQPVAVRASSLTMAPVRTSAPDAFASTSGSVPRPPASVVNTGRRGPPGPSGGSSEPAASVSDGYRRDAAASAGSVASKDSSE